MKSKKYIMFKILNVNRCYKEQLFSNFLIYVKDEIRGGIRSVPYSTDLTRLDVHGYPYVHLIEENLIPVHLEDYRVIVEQTKASLASERVKALAFGDVERSYLEARL